MSGHAAPEAARPRLAFFTPVWPERCGVSDYSEELLPYLQELADVDLVIGPYQPSSDGIRQRFRSMQPDEFLAHRDSYTAAVYQVANSLHHGYMIPYARTVPGIVVMHDYCLQHLMLGITVRQGDLGELERMLAATYGARARSLARRILFGLADPATLSFAGSLVQDSRAIVVHSENARQRILADFPAAAVRVVFHGVPAQEDTEAADALRTRYGFGSRDFVLASISTAAHTKRLDLVVRALADVRRRWPTVKLLVLGGGSIGARTRRLIDRLGVAHVVTRTGWVSNEQYRDLIRLADLVVDVRYPSGAETSGSLLRAFAAGKPAVLSAQGSFLDVPDECCVKLPVDGREVPALTSAIFRLLEHPERRREMGAAARRLVLTHHRLEQAARGLVEVVREVAARPPAPAAEPASERRNGSRVARPAVAAAYRLSRIGQMLRVYGVRDTVRRIREELGVVG